MSFLLERTNELANCLKLSQFTKRDVDVSIDEAFENLYELLKVAKRDNKKVYVVGNGGSAGIASHHVVDLVNVVNVAAFTISDSNLITCMGNDYGYSTIYARPLEVFADEGDILIAISSSGNSENILETCKVMSRKKGHVVTLSGFNEDNPLRSLGDLNIWTDSQDYGIVESAHFFILHTLIDGWKKNISVQELLELKT